MATPINSPLTREIWHLSIDDLLAPSSETPRLGGAGPFVINLSASTAPISVPITGIAGGQAHVYQLQRPEDGRMRYRLRLGPFAKEEEADAVLLKVREIYPGALTATAGPDDLRAIAALQAKAAPPPTINERATEQRSPALAVPPAAPAAPPAPAYLSPRIPVLLTEVVSRSPAPISRTATATPLREVRPPSRSAPSLETTQTVRALTPFELEDQEAMRWFVIQLSLAEDAIDPNSVPSLDIFSVYRLYAVAGLDQGRVMHALRLGFFSEELAAAAVASYLSAYYEKPTIKRVSAEERDRFADQRVEARKDVGATGRHAVIEITSERVVRNTVSTMKTETPPSALVGLRTVK